MRLNPDQAQLINQCVHRHLGDAARVWLFGSRLDDERRGGDIDLYVETAARSLMSELLCKRLLEEALDTPVDLIVRPPGDASPVAVIARTEGVVL
jgi:predicted nucleotidyltransferase